MKEFKKFRAIDPDVTKVQENVQEYLRQITQNPVLDGLLLQDITLSSASVTNVNHGLGRAPIGWIVTRQRASSIIWDSQDSNTLPSKTLQLNCSSDVVVDLWIF